MGPLLAVVLGSSMAGACSAPVDCKPPIPPGRTYQVTLTSETATSDKCHVVDGRMISPFMLSVGEAKATDSNPSCDNSPAASPPVQNDVIIQHCLPTESGMLGIYCTMKYPSTCEGEITFYFMNPPGTQVDWNAPTIENVLFRVEDKATSCLPDIANCLDEYTAKLVRVQG